MSTEERLAEALAELATLRQTALAQQTETQALLCAVQAIGEGGSPAAMFERLFEALAPTLGFTHALAAERQPQGLVGIAGHTPGESWPMEAILDAVPGHGVLAVFDTARVPGAGSGAFLGARSLLLARVDGEPERLIVLTHPGVGHFDGRRTQLVRQLLGPLRQAMLLDATRARALNSLARFPDENPEPVLRLSLDGHELYRNPAADALLTQIGGEVPDELKDLMFGSERTGSAHVEWSGRHFDVVVARFPDSGYVNFYLRDETARVRTERELARTSSRFRALITHHRAGLLVLDERGRVAFVNDAFGRLFDTGPAEAIEGLPGRELMHAQSHRFADPEAIERLFANERGTHVLRLADGRIVECEELPIRTDTGRGGHLWQFRDVTARWRAERALHRAKREAEAARDAKADFLAHVSHEVRTPLHALLGMTQLLGETRLTGEQQAYARSIHTNAEAMLALINDVLDVSRLEDGGLRLLDEPMSLRRLLEGVVLSQAGRVRSGVELYAVVDPLLPAQVLGDEARLRQVLTNLVSNAAKYTDRGEIAVAAKLLERRDGRVRLQLVVRDTGVGISFAQQERIFQKYVQTHEHRGGTGLGLHITRSIIELMRGELTLVSRPGAGATFTVEVDLGVSLERDAELDGRTEGLRGLRLAVLGANRYATRALSAPLISLGLEAAQLRCDKNPPTSFEGFDVVVVDTRVPTEMRGLLARSEVHLVHAQPLTEGTTQPAEEHTVFLPLRPEHLIEAIQACTRPVDEEEDDVTAVDPRGPALRVLVVEDNPENRALARQVLQRAGHQVVLAEGGHAGVERARAGDLDVVLMDLHMPEVDGFETIRRIRHAEQVAGVPHLPIIAYSAHATPEVRERALDVGCCDFVPKPSQSHELMAALNRAASPRARVLVVDDAADTRRLVRHLLRREGFRVACASGGDEALEYLDRNPVDAVLLDVEMPGRDGVSTVRELRKRGWNVPVVATTGHVGRDHEWRSAGFDATLSKPFDRRKLVETLDLAMKAGTDVPAPRRTSHPVVASVDAELEPLIPAFLRDRRSDVKRLRAGIAAGDVDTVRRIGHSMRGTGSAYGFPDISELGAAIERAAGEGSLEHANEATRALDGYLGQVRVQYH
ncbi:MAG: response regulator [Deltaproteobacteria bacterium]|nr:MAG: response regulator [Deltaproteobacteria bacterium]